MLQQKHTRPVIGSGWFMGCLGLTLAASANAVSFDTGHSDIRLDWDSTLKYTGGWRTAARDSRLANSPSRDEGEYSVDRGDMIMNRADVFTQIDLIYRQNNGVRISAAGWYDFGFDRNVKQNPALNALSSYEGNRFSSEVQRFYKGPSGEILDAFVFTTVDIGDTPLNLRLGQHTVYWGTSIYDHFSNGIAYGQAPVDARKSAMIPGTTAQELFLPVAQLSLQSQITDQLSLSGQYMFDWKPTRFSEGGTYFAGSDALFSAPDRRPTAADPLVTEPHLDNLEPGRKHGSFGLSLAWMPEFLGGELTAFYRQFDDPTPWLAPQSINGGYRLVYPEDIRLFGLSLNRDIAGNSLGVELSMRRNTPQYAAERPWYQQSG